MNLDNIFLILFELKSDDMRSKDSKITIIIGILLVSSLVSGGAAAILVEGLAYDIIYAIHKITSVLFAIGFVIMMLRLRKEKEF